MLNFTILRRELHFISRNIQKFTLSNSFIQTYKNVIPEFGFNGLGMFVYQRTYSRIKEDGNNEQWYETVQRVVEGAFNIAREHLLLSKKFDIQQEAQKMYDLIFKMKFLPPGRGLWAMGSPLTEERKLFATLNNCGFVSTEKIAIDPSKPFCFAFDSLMLGIGIGFDIRGKNIVRVNKPLDKVIKFKIPDSREGWVESLKLLLDSYFFSGNKVEFDYTGIRKEGEILKGFGGKASGYKNLENMHKSIHSIFQKRIGSNLRGTDIVDIMNIIGRCVVSGNVRRSAEIALGDIYDKEYIDLKNYDKNPQRLDFGWLSNNSVFANVGDDYSELIPRITRNGEPGILWLENMQKYSRMNDIEDFKDIRALGGNPCLEQTLESYELCCLVETFPNKHKTLNEFKETLKYAFMYAKFVTLGKVHWPESVEIMERNRRIGTSMSGIAQFITQRGIATLKKWCVEGYRTLRHYDEELSCCLKIPQSVKITSVKPSGTVSLLAGATPGIHYPESKFYIRRVRIAKNSSYLRKMRENGYKIEDDVNDPQNTAIIEFPISLGSSIRTLDEVSLWEQLSLAAFLQKYWADNQVSCTVTFNPESEKDQILHALHYFQFQLKGISFLPRKKNYKQMVYEEISEEEYNVMEKKITNKNIDINSTDDSNEFKESDKYCDSDKCKL